MALNWFSWEGFLSNLYWIKDFSSSGNLVLNFPLIILIPSLYSSGVHSISSSVKLYSFWVPSISDGLNFLRKPLALPNCDLSCFKEIETKGASVLPQSLTNKPFNLE